MIARRLAPALAVLLGLAAGIAPAAANEADEILLRIEAPDAALRSLRDLPEQIAPLAGAPAGHTSMAAAAVDEAFDESETLAAVRSAVAEAGPDADATGLAGAAERFEAAAAEWDAFRTDGEASTDVAALAEMKTRFEARPDRERIVELAESMALPELRGEVALAAARIERMLALPHDVGVERLRGAEPAELADEARRFVAESRASGGDAAPHASREFATTEGEGWTMVRLALLDEADIAALHAFYSSAEGRAKRDALVSSFAAQNDADAEVMLLAFVEALRAEPD